MKNILSNKTLQATYGGDVIGGSVVPGMLGAFLFWKGGVYGKRKGETKAKEILTQREWADWGVNAG